MIINEHISGRIECGNQTFALNNSNVISASCKQQCCANDSFEIGGVYAATLNLTCRLSGAGLFAVRGAKIILYSRYGSESDPYCIGIFWVTNAARTGDIFTLSATDSIGWLDTSSYNDGEAALLGGVGKYFEAQGYGYDIQGWCAQLTTFVNSLVARLTGVSGLLSWVNYDSSVNGYHCNERIYAHDESPTVYPATFWLSTETGVGNSDSPRDFYHYLAEIAGGFIYARPSDGALTLGQFAQPEFGTVRLDESEMQFDSCDIAEYILHLIRMTAQSEILEGAADQAIWISPVYDSPNIRFQIQSNPFLDGFTAAWIRGDAEKSIDDLWTICHGLYRVLYRYNGGVIVRPFRCTAHTEKRFSLGQKIILSTKNQSCESIITSIQWTFRGGHVISCGGSDSRVMSDCIRASKSDKACNESRYRYAVLERRISALENNP